jgi:hypothetical protein
MREARQRAARQDADLAAGVLINQFDRAIP